MQIKAILKSLFLAYTLTGLNLLLLAFLLFQFDISQMSITAGITITYVLACFLGGFAVGKMLGRKRYLYGGAVGICYLLLLVLVSIAVEGRLDMTLMHLGTTFCMCLGAGTLGGMFS